MSISFNRTSSLFNLNCNVSLFKNPLRRVEYFKLKIFVGVSRFMCLFMAIFFVEYNVFQQIFLSLYKLFQIIIIFK